MNAVLSDDCEAKAGEHKMTVLARNRKKPVGKTGARRPKSHTLPVPEQRVLLHGLTWHDYIQLGNILCDRPALRLTFDRGTLEIMVPSREHEFYKTRLGRLIEILAEEFNRRINPGGNMTFQREELERGLEPDNCWWIEHEEQVRGKLTWDPAVDPPPDLLLEIEVSRLARMAIYAALKVPQVWCFDGKSLRVYLLQPEGTYLQANESPTFPGIPVAEIVRFLLPEQDYLTVQREFRAWAKRQRGRKTRGGRKRTSK
jgi:Uma2 family endonuclease